MRLARGRALQPELRVEDVVALGAAIGHAVGPALLVILAGAFLATAAAGTASTGFNVAPKSLGLHWERLDVMAAAREAWGSSQPWIALAKGLLVAGLLGWATWSCAAEHLDAVPGLAAAPAAAQLGFAAEILRDFVQRVLPVALGIGAADYLWQRFRLSQQMRMNKQEIRDEHKEQEGDPQLRSRRRQRQRQIALGSSLRAVRTAQVVITNPTHYAVALRYRREENAAPVVVARGLDHLALRIRAEATVHDVPIIENRPLARALYARAKLGKPIPAEFYGPVAQVLAIVFRRRRGGVSAPADRR